MCYYYHKKVQKKIVVTLNPVEKNTQLVLFLPAATIRESARVYNDDY